MDEIDFKELARQRARLLAEAAAAEGKYLEWFERLYREADRDEKQIPWADLEPNRFLSNGPRASASAAPARKLLLSAAVSAMMPGT